MTSDAAVPATIPELLRAQRLADGGRELVVLGERRLTYAEADAQSALLARGLLARGAGKGTRIALLLPNGPDWVLAWLAATRIGALVVPLNTFSKARELGWALRHCDAQMLLAATRFLTHDYLARLEEAVPGLANARDTALREPSLPFLRSVLTWGEPARAWASEGPATLRRLGTAIDAELLAAAESEVAPADPIVIIYSSGSTAEPKGAVHTQAGLLRHAHNLARLRGLVAEDRIYSPMPFFWVGGLVFTLLASMQAGATVLAEEAFEPGHTLDVLERERVTIVIGWPHYGKALAEHATFAARDLSAIRAGNLHALLPAHVRPRDPELRGNSLGMTETAGPHTFAPMDVDLPEELRGSFGTAVPGIEHKIVDPETGAVLPPGTTGEICVRGASLMQGLYKVERADTFDADGYYHTGDSGCFDERGNLFFRGRLGDVIKTGGANVSPREIEVVLESMPEVREAYVVGLPDRERGQLVAAVVVLKSEGSLAGEELRRRLARELSSYKVPRVIHVFRHEELPFTDTGKVDKRRLASRLVDLPT